jgi:hypothetical protein
MMALVLEEVRNLKIRITINLFFKVLRFYQYILISLLVVGNSVMQGTDTEGTSPEYSSESSDTTSISTEKQVSKVKRTMKRKEITKVRPSNDYVQFQIGFTSPKIVSASGTTRRARSRALKLYAFPDLDRCNSLLYFPATITRLMNSGDFKELEKMLNSRVANKSYFQFPGGDELKTTTEFVEKMKIKDSIHPDSMTCVRGTKVVGNQIIATAYFKFTDNLFIYNAVVPNLPNVLSDACVRMGGTRSERLLSEVQPSFANEEQRAHAVRLLDSDEDLVVYGTGTMTLTLDEFSKKIVTLSFCGKVTSVAAASSPNVNIISCNT